jgi:hypothetical protein
VGGPFTSATHSFPLILTTAPWQTPRTRSRPAYVAYMLRSARILRLPQEEETDAHFEPVIKLTEQVETKTNEEEEESTFKMYVLLYSCDARICTW